MKCDAERLKAILVASRSEAVKRLITQDAAQFSRTEIAEIEIELLMAAPSKANIVELFATLRQMLATGNPDHAAARMPRVAFNYPTPSNPFADGILDSEETYRHAAQWLEENLQASHKRITSSDPNHPVPSLFAMFVVAAIIEFEILHADFVPALIEALQQRRTVPLHRAMIGVSLELPYGRQDNAEARQVVVRGKAAMLLRRLLAHSEFPTLLNGPLVAGAKSRQAGVIRAIDQEIASTGIVSQGFSLSTLLRAARQLAVTRTLPVIAAHRSRHLVSHSLRPQVIARIQGNRGVPDVPSKRLARAEPAAENATEEADSEEMDWEPIWMTQLRKALKKDRIDRDILQSLASGTEISGQRMAEFALYLSVRLKPSSIQRYVFLIATRVMPRFEHCDPLEVDEEAWEEVVEQVLDEDVFFHRERDSDNRHPKGNGYSIALIKALRHFFWFLSQRRGKALAHLKGMLPGTGLLKVDANIITVDEYKAALDWLSGPSGFSDLHLRDASRVALMLGYRCGLRRAEAAYLRACDFDPADHLHVRPCSLRKLKTSNARRDLPLRVLLPTEELEEVLKFVSARDRAGSNREDALLFSVESNPQAPINFERVIGQVHCALRIATGDESLHYHHLRHSFANMLLLKLWPALHPVARHVFHHHPATVAWFDEPESFRRQLFGTSAIRGSDLQAIALLMGHGGSATTLEHYIHVLDWYSKDDRRDTR
jgi:integrase